MMRSFLVDLHKPSLAASDFTQSPAADLSRIAKLLECPKSDKTCDQRKKLADAVSQLIVDRKNGFYTLDWSAKASGSEALTIEARFEAFFKTSEPTYSVTCTGRIGRPSSCQASLSHPRHRTCQNQQ